MGVRAECIAREKGTVLTRIAPQFWMFTLGTILSLPKNVCLSALVPLEVSDSDFALTHSSPSSTSA